MKFNTNFPSDLDKFTNKLIAKYRSDSRKTREFAVITIENMQLMKLEYEESYSVHTSHIKLFPSGIRKGYRSNVDKHELIEVKTGDHIGVREKYENNYVICTYVIESVTRKVVKAYLDECVVITS